jgi:hypothetical protein
MGPFTHDAGLYHVTVGVDAASRFSWLTTLRDNGEEQCLHAAHCAMEQALARRTWDPALPTPEVVVFSSSIACSFPPSVTINTQDHNGNSMRLLVTLERSPSEGSYVSAAEAVAWHILARADNFMRRSDLCLEVL